MFDREISLGCTVAYGLWTLALVAMGVGTMHESLTWQSWSLLSGLGGGTATIRSYFVRNNRLMREALAQAGHDPVAVPLRRQP